VALARKFAATQDMKVKEEIERLSIEVGKLKEPWRFMTRLKKEAFMIAAVRKFSIEYQGHWAPVLFIRDTAGATAEPFQFWIRGDDGTPYGVPLNEVTDIKADDD